MTDCIFCKIGAGEIPSQTVYENEVVRVFRDIHPKAPIHLLIIPKEHIESIAHLSEGHETLIAQLIYVAKRVAAGQGLTGYKLVFNVGRDGGQVVDHLHLHLIGGWLKGEGGNLNI